ncbi:MAG: EAL domain-containing protein [Luteimonas sp.]
MPDRSAHASAPALAGLDLVGLDRAFADRLLHATTPAQVADVLLDGDLDALGGSTPAPGTCVLWSSRWPQAIEAYPSPCLEADALAAAMAAVQALRDGTASTPSTQVLCDQDSAVAVLHVPQGNPPSVETLLSGRTRMAEVLAIERLHDTVAQLAQTEQLQRALFAITDMAGSDLDMPDMLRGLHRIVGELMYADNFFIALYDPGADSIRFLYFVDSVDQENPAGATDFPLDRIKHGPTWWMIRERKPLMGSDEQLQAQVPGPLNIHGAESDDWLGVPMLRDGHVRGVVVVQSYLANVGFTSADMALLGFVSQHILTALERKQGQEELERRVEERTGQLAESNEDLRKEITERLRGERLQSALYQIAALAVSTDTGERFYARVHRIISGLLDVENFYIALLSEDGLTVTFPYVRDAHETQWPTRPLARGLTEFALRSGRTQLVSEARALELEMAGEINLEFVGAIARQWLGVPLLAGDEPIGVLAVQSYTDENAYNTADAELLDFVATQLASSLQRRRELAQRERSEHLKGALYQIAALAVTDDSSERFFRQVHIAVSDLINADNFYIALLSDDSTELHFPYYVDQHHAVGHDRALGRGLTEYTLRSGRAQLVEGAQGARALVEAGEIDKDYLNSPTTCWLGVPLISSDATLGVVAVQSYTSQVRYDQRDAELLTFVSHQLASSIQRRRTSKALRLSNTRLEERVEERTRELREQIKVREQIEAQLQHQVMHDPLTGLPNRLYLRDRLERAIAGVRRNKERRFALLYLDVDRFKVVNDSLGHLAGDQVLQEVARRLGECVREPDVVARLSGDEFALLLQDAPFPQTASKVAQRVLEALRRPLFINAHELHPSASIGIAIGDEFHSSADELLRDADIALYRAKSAGRQRFVMFDESLQRGAMDVLQLEHELHEALSAGQFEPYFQPLVRLSDAATVGYEALVRWHHPQRGVLLPGDFLRVAEDSGQIEAIDWQMYRLACNAGAALVRDGGFITINISPRHFQNDDLDARLLAVTTDTGFDPAKLRIEVTEGTLLGDPTAVAKVLQRLRDACIEAALDDFGTGYSSLGYVHRFPLKMIKIDKSFVAPLGQEDAPRSLAVISAILALARSLGLEVVAEGIETEQQLRILRDMGCVYGQGYFFGRPKPADYWITLEKNGSVTT